VVSNLAIFDLCSSCFFPLISAANCVVAGQKFLELNLKRKKDLLRIDQDLLRCQIIWARFRLL
jgi:hypothetical protein